MSKQSALKLQAVILECCGSGIFKAELDNGHIVTCHLSGKIRMHKINILVGDTVIIECSPYSLNVGRITTRLSHAVETKMPLN